jgi:hypothetical protein
LIHKTRYNKEHHQHIRIIVIITFSVKLSSEYTCPKLIVTLIMQSPEILCNYRRVSGVVHVNNPGKNAEMYEHLEKLQSNLEFGYCSIE